MDNKLNELFEPIFEWIKENYPDGAYFLVDKNSAKLYANESLAIYSQEIRNYSLGEAVNDIVNCLTNNVEDNTEVTDKKTATETEINFEVDSITPEEIVVNSIVEEDTNSKYIFTLDRDILGNNSEGEINTDNDTK